MKTSSKILIVVLGLVFFSILFIVSIYPSTLYLIIGLLLNVLVLSVLSGHFNIMENTKIPKSTIVFNGEIKVCIKEIHSLFNIALEEVMIISGGLNEKIWGQEIIIKDFESFKERKIKLTIIVGEKFNPKANSKLHLFLKKNVGSDFLRLYIYPDSNGPINHLIIVDNAHLRLEQKHTEEDSKRSAEIRYYAGSLAGRAKVKFEEYRIKSRLLLKEDFKELVEA